MGNSKARPKMNLVLLQIMRVVILLNLLGAISDKVTSTNKIAIIYVAIILIAVYILVTTYRSNKVKKSIKLTIAKVIVAMTPTVAGIIVIIALPRSSIITLEVSRLVANVYIIEAIFTEMGIFINKTIKLLNNEEDVKWHSEKH